MRRSWLSFVCALTLTSTAGCGTDDDPTLDPRYEEPGPHQVGNATFTATDAARGRTLTIEVWYPRASAEPASEPVTQFVVDPDDRAIYEQLLADAPAGCPSTDTASARDATPAADGPLPLLAFSHCHNCTRFSSFAIAERLASHGFVVAAPDHADNTLFDDLAGTGAELDAEFLAVRAADISFVLDVMLAGDHGLDLTLDPARVGVYGHSFGAVTTGLVIQDDPRPVAGFAIASPMENPLLQGVEVDDLVDPIGFLVAVEDNSITEIGNVFIRRNFDEAPVPAFKAEVADAGHWSFSDMCAVHPQFAACCGAAERQTDGTSFNYLPVDNGIAVAQAYVTAFFSQHLLDDENAARYLAADRFAGVSLESRDGGAP